MTGHPRMTTEQIAGMDNALVLIENERHHQHAKWGEQNHPNGTAPGELWPGIFSRTMLDAARIAKIQVDLDCRRGEGTYAGILLEEVFEALAEEDPARLRSELIQVAAVAVAWIEKLERQAATS